MSTLELAGATIDYRTQANREGITLLILEPVYCVSIALKPRFKKAIKRGCIGNIGATQTTEGLCHDVLSAL